MFITTIIKQLKSISNKCTTLDEANILLSSKEEDKEFSLFEIQKLIPRTTENGECLVRNPRFTEINKTLIELIELLDKQFPEEIEEES